MISHGTFILSTALQETGDTLTAVIRSLSDALASAADESPEKLRSLLKPTVHKRLFLSIGGKYMLTYSMTTAELLHNVPLVMVGTAPMILGLLVPGKVYGVLLLQSVSCFSSCLRGT